MPLLPQELARADERRGILELPPDDVAPLIQLQRQIPVTANPLCVERVHDGFRGWTDRNVLLQFRVPGLGHPRNLGGKVFHVILLGLEGRLGHEHGELSVLHAELFDPVVEPAVDELPDLERPGAQDVAAADVTILDHLRLLDDILVPLCEVAALRVLDRHFVLLFFLGPSLVLGLGVALLRLWLLRFCCRLGGFRLASIGGARVSPLLLLRKGEIHWIVLIVLKKADEVLARQAGGAIVAQRMQIDDGRLPKVLVHHYLHVLLGVVHDCEGRDRPLRDAQLLEEQLFRTKSEVHLPSKLQVLPELLHIHLLRVLRDHQEEPVLLVSQEQVLREQAG
mmetsp:Transcript_12635/g.46666  ORF Transcript_12635/g.46666 Transcript_12635/m.46666 type:complete len:337 (+) Transcript_12635:2355-3365(+)